MTSFLFDTHPPLTITCFKGQIGKHYLLSRGSIEAIPTIPSSAKRAQEEDSNEQYQGVRGMWGKRMVSASLAIMPRKKAKMEEIRRWGKRSIDDKATFRKAKDEKNLRGMWGKRSSQMSLPYPYLNEEYSQPIILSATEFEPQDFEFRNYELLNTQFSPPWLQLRG